MCINYTIACWKQQSSWWMEGSSRDHHCSAPKFLWIRKVQHTLCNLPHRSSYKWLPSASWFLPVTAMQLSTHDECAWDETVSLVCTLLSQYCTTVVSPETRMAFAFQKRKKKTSTFINYLIFLILLAGKDKIYSSATDCCGWVVCAHCAAILNPILSTPRTSWKYFLCNLSRSCLMSAAGNDTGANFLWDHLPVSYVPYL